MLNYESLFLFIFVFSSLLITRRIFQFVGTLLLNEPKPMILSNRELLYLGLSISYFLTYLIKL